MNRVRRLMVNCCGRIRANISNTSPVRAKISILIRHFIRRSTRTDDTLPARRSRHHATRDRAMGFCYFSNIAITALDALANRAERVAIWDFDAHHGNGTEAIVAQNPQIAFASIHQFPAYPGTGAQSFGNVENYPVAPYTPRAQHVDVAERALQKLLKFKPDLVLVSAGFDAYSGDPLIQMTLEQEDFAKFGEWLRKANMPTAAILEGGYSDQLPELIDAFLAAWTAK